MFFTLGFQRNVLIKRFYLAHANFYAHILIGISVKVGEISHKIDPVIKSVRIFPCQVLEVEHIFTCILRSLDVIFPESCFGYHTKLNECYI